MMESAMQKTVIRRVRNAARALIIREEKLLAVKLDNGGRYELRDGGDFVYILPGGGQRGGEVLTESLRRECREEIGADIEVAEMLLVREYIGRNHSFSRAHRSFHQVEVIFRCRLPHPEQVRSGGIPDKRQAGIEWLGLDQLNGLPFYPEALKPYFKDGGFHPPATYLGDVN